MSLPVKKIYVDSRFKTKDSVSDSNFKFELSQSLTLPKNSTCYIDDITIPHSWYNINESNNRLYMLIITLTQHLVLYTYQLKTITAQL